ncbi:MAG: hypothetical protein Q8N63_02885 [Nanoarchaeota archaeon]|nr:hypothetical protein [Nanoarchaeota archaeon]
MKKLTEILNLSKFTSYKARSYYDTFIVGGGSIRAFDCLREGDYKNFILWGIPTGIFALMAYLDNKTSMKNENRL